VYIALRNHTEYSLLESSCRVKALVKKAKQFQMPALAITDNGNMFAAIEFYFACKDQNIKPLLGLEIFLAPKGRLIKDPEKEKSGFGLTRLVLLAQDIDGYRNLCRISTTGFQEGFYYKPRVDYDVLKQWNSSIICLSGGFKGEIFDTFINEGFEEALKKVKLLKSLFGDRFYLEYNYAAHADNKEFYNFVLECEEKHFISVVGTNDTYYLTHDDQISQDVLTCISGNRLLSDENRFKFSNNHFYFKSPEEMQMHFSKNQEWLLKTLEIADRCDLKFKLKDEKSRAIYHLPSFPVSEGRGLKEEIREMSLKGLQQRFLEMKSRGEVVEDADTKKYLDRLDYELSVIDKMGFNGYFLIVQDFINWAKSVGIPVGPGRGSGAGSIVAYSLRITDLDPVPYSLLFERFLNPERISMPDFDIDFCQHRRGEVIDYVTNKYGKESVSQIITYGKLQTRAAIKDVGRVLGMTFQEVDQVTKLIPDKLNITISESLEMEPRLREQMEMNPQVSTLIDLAQRVEGLVRHAGIHAAGVIIADGSLLQHAPLYKGADGENVVQYDMKHAEKIGLIKFDFLGLKTLTLIHQAFKLIEKNHGKKIIESDISLNDPGIYQLMARGDTLGVFQFEGDGITDAIRKIKPNCFADITAINALYRPGPMAMIPDFAKRKNGESKVEYLLPELKDILEETYGIIVYQEQVMAIASRIAGYSLGEADMLRRAMGKKIKEEMDLHRVKFLEGAKKQNFDEEKSAEIFELMYKFADYGFNKSHAAAYCVIAAQTAYLKNYYPAEFYAALMTTELGDIERVMRYVKDAQQHGIEVYPPSLNDSEFHFSVRDGKIYFGLGGIKGVGESAIHAITEARNSLPKKQFSSLEEFFSVVDPKKLNKKVMESLIKAGAFDCFKVARHILMASFPEILEQADRKKKEKEIGQSSLFDNEFSESVGVQLKSVPPWSKMALLAYEKEVIGFYLSDHPLSHIQRYAKMWVTGDIDKCFLNAEASKTTEENSLESKKDFNKGNSRMKKNGPRLVFLGILNETRELITKKGTRMAFSRLEDMTGSCELVVFPDTFAKSESYIKSDKPLLVAGNQDLSSDTKKLIVDSMMTFEDVMKKIKILKLDLTDFSQEQIEKIYDTLLGHKGSTEVQFFLKLKDENAEVILETEERLSVHFDFKLLDSMENLVGHTSFIKIENTSESEKNKNEKFNHQLQSHNA